MYPILHITLSVSGSSWKQRRAWFPRKPRIAGWKHYFMFRVDCWTLCICTADSRVVYVRNVYVRDVSLVGSAWTSRCTRVPWPCREKGEFTHYNVPRKLLYFWAFYATFLYFTSGIFITSLAIYKIIRYYLFVCFYLFIFYFLIQHVRAFSST